MEAKIPDEIKEWGIGEEEGDSEEEGDMIDEKHNDMEDIEEEKNPKSFHEKLWLGDNKLAGLPDSKTLLKKKYPGRPDCLNLGGVVADVKQAEDGKNDNVWHIGEYEDKNPNVGDIEAVKLPDINSRGRIDTNLKGKVNVSVKFIQFMNDIRNERSKLKKKVFESTKNSILLGKLLKKLSDSHQIQNEVLAYSSVKDGKTAIAASPTLAYCCLSFYGEKKLEWYKDFIAKEKKNKKNKGQHYTYSSHLMLLHLISSEIKTSTDKEEVINATKNKTDKEALNHIVTVDDNAKQIVEILRQVSYLNIEQFFAKINVAKQILPVAEEQGKLLDLPPAEYAAYKKVQGEKRAKAQTNVLDFNVDQIIRFKNKLIASKHWMDKVLLVQLCTGSRFIEVLRVSHYYTVPEADACGLEYKDNFIPDDDEQMKKDMNVGGSIVVVGVAKSRNKKSKDKESDQIDIEDDDVDHELMIEDNRVLPAKPVMFITPQHVVHLVYDIIRPQMNTLLSNMKKKPKQMTLRILTSNFNGEANERMKSFPLTSQGGSVTTHWLRKIYANYSYDNVGDKLSITKTAWITRVLGHLPKSFTTALAYNTASISHGAPVNDHEDPEKMKEEVRALVDFYHEQTKSFWDLVSGGELLNGMKQVETHTDEVMAKLNNLRSSDKRTLTHVSLYANGTGYKFRRLTKGTSRVDRIAYFHDATSSMEEKNIPTTYENYRRIGFANSFIRRHRDL
jgi:hypothetical protein